MATFKVGQRVRIIGCDPQSECARVGGLGVQAVITAIPSKFARVHPAAECDIRADGQRIDWVAAFRYLAPLTDPKADQFIEWVKKIKPEPVAVPVAELQRTK